MMGDAADDLMNHEIDLMLYPKGIDHWITEQTHKHNRKVIGRSKWKTRDGVEMTFDEMDLRHLGNVVRIVEKRQHRYASELREYYENRVKLKQKESSGGG